MACKLMQYCVFRIYHRRNISLIHNSNEKSGRLIFVLGYLEECIHVVPVLTLRFQWFRNVRNEIGTKWILLARNKDQRKALLNTSMSLRVPWRTERVREWLLPKINLAGQRYLYRQSKAVEACRFVRRRDLTFSRHMAHRWQWACKP
jgi:hypothetical protein